VALLIAVVALVHLANGLLGAFRIGDEPVSLQRTLGWLLAPLAWLIGLPWSDCAQGGALLGLKLVLNELVAYAELAALPADALQAGSRLRLGYALCGFANLGSLAILIAGLASLAPARRPEIIALGSRSVVAGTLASCLTATVAGAWLA
jgi:concentrative nucleoside transporter, CNT family